MRMNKLEKLAMNNPVRLLFQRYYEIPLLEQLGGRLDGLEVLEVGCGRGAGTQLILERLGAARVTATDLDPDMLLRARRRLERYSSARVMVQRADASRLDFPDQAFDAVVSFAAIHHVPRWRDALGEVRRVLRPGGRFVFEEVTSQWIGRWPYRALFEHPQDRFSARELHAELERLDIQVGDSWATRAGGDFVFGVGRRRCSRRRSHKQEP